MDRKITLIRHGSTPGNNRKCYIGITDESLSKDGENQIKERLYPKADIVFSSPLSRCLQTAKLIYPNQAATTVEDLRETDFGDFEGKNYQDLADNPAYQSWIDSGGEETFPNGESREQASARAISGFEQVLAQSNQAESISVVAHGGTIMAILSHFFGGDYYSYHVENGEGYTFDLSHDSIFSGLSPRSFIR